MPRRPVKKRFGSERPHGEFAANCPPSRRVVPHYEWHGPSPPPTASRLRTPPHYRTSAKEFTFASFVTRPSLSSRLTSDGRREEGRLLGDRCSPKTYNVLPPNPLTFHIQLMRQNAATFRRILEKMPPFECLVPPKVDFLGYKLIMCISYIVTHIYII